MRQTKTRKIKSRKRRFDSRLVVGTLVVLLIVVSVAKMQLNQKAESNMEYMAELQAELDTEVARQEELEELKKYIQTKAYVEEVAKERLGLVYEGEILFKANN